MSVTLVAPKRTSRQRARITNGRSVFIDRTDGRSPTVRRFKDLYEAYSTKLGADLSPVHATMLRNICATDILLERMQLALARGDDLDLAEYVRLQNLQRRSLAAVGLIDVPDEDTGPSLTEYLAGRSA